MENFENIELDEVGAENEQENNEDQREPNIDSVQGNENRKPTTWMKWLRRARLLACLVLACMAFLFISSLFTKSGLLLCPKILDYLITTKNHGNNSKELYKDADGQKGLTWVAAGHVITAITQSSSVTTATTARLIHEDNLSLQAGIFLVYGANLGTTITTTIMSFTFHKDRAQFRRAFQVASMHNMFNICTATVLASIEWTPILFGSGHGPMKMLIDSLVHARHNTCHTAKLEKVTHRLQNNLSLVEAILDEANIPFESKNTTEMVRKLIHHVEDNNHKENEVYKNITDIVDEVIEETKETRSWFDRIPVIFIDSRGNLLDTNTSHIVKCDEQWHFFCNWHQLGEDTYAGILILVIALFLLFLDFRFIYNIGLQLNPFKTSIDMKVFCYNPYCNYFLYNAFFFVIGFIATATTLSSSVFITLIMITTAREILKIDQTYWLVLGSNLGTTISILYLPETQSELLDPYCAPGFIQIFYVHLFFNLTGCFLFSIPAMRIPLRIAQRAGEIAHAFRWTAVFSFFLFYLLWPAVTVPFVLYSPVAFYVFCVFLIAFFIIIFFINWFQSYNDGVCLPECLRTWGFLPHWMRSFQPITDLIDKAMNKLTCGSSNIDDSSFSQTNPDSNCIIL